jgi:hypothetical protein
LNSSVIKSNMKTVIKISMIMSLKLRIAKNTIFFFILSGIKLI